jgi:predicted metal-binding membrane protein
MPGITLDAVLKRDRIIIALSLAAITLLAWLYLLSLADMTAPGAKPMEPMDGMADMPGMGDMPGMAEAMLTPRAWRPGEAFLVFAMWSVMMVGMMLPSAAPMILLYARVGRHAASQGAPFAATGIFGSGYVAAWLLFALVATFGQWLLERALLLTPMMESASGLFSGMLLLFAGLYQWTPLKHACLSKCRAPVAFIQSEGGFRREPWGAFRMGLRHGLYCVGCCWPLMALLFVGGVMNILWIAGLAIFVLAEKVMPGGKRLSQVAGAILLAAGVWLMIRGLS